MEPAEHTVKVSPEYNLMLMLQLSNTAGNLPSKKIQDFAHSVAQTCLSNGHQMATQSKKAQQIIQDFPTSHEFITNRQGWNSKVLNLSNIGV